MKTSLVYVGYRDELALQMAGKHLKFGDCEKALNVLKQVSRPCRNRLLFQRLLDAAREAWPKTMPDTKTAHELRLDAA